MRSLPQKVGFVEGVGRQETGEVVPHCGYHARDGGDLETADYADDFPVLEGDGKG